MAHVFRVGGAAFCGGAAPERFFSSLMLPVWHPGGVLVLELGLGDRIWRFTIPIAIGTIAATGGAFYISRPIVLFQFSFSQD